MRDTIHPATTRLIAKLEEIGLHDDAQQRDFAAWMSGIRAAQLDDLGQLTPGDAMQVVNRIENSWLTDSLLDEWRAARRKEADTARADAEYGAYLISDDSGSI